jgi:hypothetical protein
MISPNSSGSTSRPVAPIGTSNAWPLGTGAWPSWPRAAARFWLRMEFATSTAVMPHAAIF